MRMVRATAQTGRLVSARELCEVHPMPFDVLSKVLQRLAHCGVVTSEQGAQGGYRLCADLDQLSLHALSEWLVGPTRFATCMDERCECQLTGSCTIISAVVNLSKRLEQFYRDVSIGDLLASEEEEAKRIRNQFSHKQTIMGRLQYIDHGNRSA